INATLGYADLLDLEVNGTLTQQQREYVSRIRGSQEHLLRIINDLLNYSRIESGRVEFDIADVSLEEVVQNVVPMVEPQASVKDLVIEFTPLPDAPLARADRARAEQIVLNLLGNAVKFTPTGGRITVTIGRSAGRVSVSVADNG